jgi:hypothetical protein
MNSKRTLTFTTESDKIEADTAASTPKGQKRTKKKVKYRFQTYHLKYIILDKYVFYTTSVLNQLQIRRQNKD